MSTGITSEGESAKFPIYGTILFTDLKQLKFVLTPFSSEDEDVEPSAIVYFPLTSPPSGYLKANGAAVSRATYVNLFARIGTYFGAGNGTTTFNLPDLRGLFPRGWDDGRGLDPGRVLGTYQAPFTPDIPRDGWGVLQNGDALPEPSTPGRLITGSGRSENQEDLESLAHASQNRVLTGDIRPGNMSLLPCIKF